MGENWGGAGNGMGLEVHQRGRSDGGEVRRGEIAVRGWRREGRTGTLEGRVQDRETVEEGGGVFAGEGSCGEGWGGTAVGRRWRWRWR